MSKTPRWVEDNCPLYYRPDERWFSILFVVWALAMFVLVSATIYWDYQAFSNIQQINYMLATLQSGG